LLCWGEPLPRTQHRIEHTAAIDVADQQHLGLGVQCHAHVDDVSGAQVDLGRAACAFGNDKLKLRAKAVQRVRDHRPQISAFRTEVVSGALHPTHLSADDDLAGPALRLEQDRIHVDRGLDAGGLGLCELGAADLTASRTHRRVVRHVLGFEGRDAQPAPGEQAAESGDQRALATRRRGALHHKHRCEAVNHG
jgi:hypothetical protein